MREVELPWVGDGAPGEMPDLPTTEVLHRQAWICSRGCVLQTAPFSVALWLHPVSHLGLGTQCAAHLWAQVRRVPPLPVKHGAAACRRLGVLLPVSQRRLPWCFVFTWMYTNLIMPSNHKKQTAFCYILETRGWQAFPLKAQTKYFRHWDDVCLLFCLFPSLPPPPKICSFYNKTEPQAGFHPQGVACWPLLYLWILNCLLKI